jgi:hypothetical protein
MNQGNNIYIYIIIADIPWAMLPILCVFYLKKLMWIRTRYLWELHVYIKHDSPPLGYNPCVAAIAHFPHQSEGDIVAVVAAN